MVTTCALDVLTYKMRADDIWIENGWTEVLKFDTVYHVIRTGLATTEHETIIWSVTKSAVHSADTFLEHKCGRATREAPSITTIV